MEIDLETAYDSGMLSKISWQRMGVLMLIEFIISLHIDRSYCSLQGGIKKKLTFCNWGLFAARTSTRGVKGSEVQGHRRHGESSPFTTLCRHTTGT